MLKEASAPRSWLAKFRSCWSGLTISKWKQFYIPGIPIYLISNYEKGLKLTTMADISSFESGWEVLHSLYRELLFFLCSVILSKYRSVYFLDSGGCKRKSPKDIIGILRNGGLHPQYENCWIQLDARSWILQHVRRGEKRKNIFSCGVFEKASIGSMLREFHTLSLFYSPSRAKSLQGCRRTSNLAASSSIQVLQKLLEVTHEDKENKVTVGIFVSRWQRKCPITTRTYTRLKVCYITICRNSAQFISSMVWNRILRSQNTELFTSRKLARAVLLTCISEVPIWNIGWDTDNHDWCFWWLSSVATGKCQDNALNQKIWQPLPSTSLPIQYYPTSRRYKLLVTNSS